jgi:long-subunit acyl-CoA synthetase (AMP-forming)
VRHIALGLQELGFARSDRVAILSENRPEWALCDWACLTLGIVDVPIYPTLPAEQVPHILNDSGATAVLVSGDAQAAKVAHIRADVPAVRHVISFSMGWTDRAELLASTAIRAKMEQEVRDALVGLASFETPKKIALLERDFTVERGELTPTLKVKRRVIERDYRQLIEDLYAGSRAGA